MDTPQYLTPEQVGERFLTTKWTVRRWIEAGRLPAVRLGRRWLIPVEAVEALGQTTQVDDAEVREIASVIQGVIPGFVTTVGLCEMVRGNEKPALAFWRDLADGIRSLQQARRKPAKSKK